MVFCFFSRLFRRGKYTVNTEDGDCTYRPNGQSHIYPPESPSHPRLVRSHESLSPMLYRYIFTASPRHPSDSDYSDCSSPAYNTSDMNDTSMVSSNEESVPRLGASIDGGYGGGEGFTSPIQDPSHYTNKAVSNGLWPSPEYSPEIKVDQNPMSPMHLPLETPYIRHDMRKRSLRKRPSLPVPGTVKQAVCFFESDSYFAQMPRRLRRVPAEFMRSAPQVNCTPTPQGTPEDHIIHSETIRGVTTTTERCTRCVTSCHTPVSRKSSK